MYERALFDDVFWSFAGSTSGSNKFPVIPVAIVGVAAIVILCICLLVPPLYISISRKLKKTSQKNNISFTETETKVNLDKKSDIELTVIGWKYFYTFY